jgi:hypothetical protein
MTNEQDRFNKIITNLNIIKDNYNHIYIFFNSFINYFPIFTKNINDMCIDIKSFSSQQQSSTSQQQSMTELESNEYKNVLNLYNSLYDVFITENDVWKGKQQPLKLEFINNLQELNENIIYMLSTLHYNYNKLFQKINKQIHKITDLKGKSSNYAIKIIIDSIFSKRERDISIKYLNSFLLWTCLPSSY